MVKSPTAEPVRETESASVQTDFDDVELITPRHPELHGFHFKVRASGRVFRLDAARDPQLPRFWCFSISRCIGSGVIDESERPWFGGDRMTREELPAAVTEIRSRFDEWLQLPQHSDLRDWIFDAPSVDVEAGKVTAAAARAI